MLPNEGHPGGLKKKTFFYKKQMVPDISPPFQPGCGFSCTRSPSSSTSAVACGSPAKGMKIYMQNHLEIIKQTRNDVLNGFKCKSTYNKL